MRLLLGAGADGVPAVATVVIPRVVTLALTGAFLRAHVMILGPSYSDSDWLSRSSSVLWPATADGIEISTAGWLAVVFVLVEPVTLLICLSGGSPFSLPDTLTALLEP